MTRLPGSLRTYKTFYDSLERLLQGSDYRKIVNPPYMNLTIERHGSQITLTHYGEQNGDLMADPDVAFEVVDWENGLKFAEPVSFQNAYAGYFSAVYTYDDNGKRVGVRPQVKAELKAFCILWFRNLREQGFFEKAKQAA
jgi:hypothetical protein